jgi:AcrR family transcriptional regulator
MRVNESSRPAERRIHEAAMRIFARTGRTDLTISELASEARVARGTIYHHSPPSDALFDNVAARMSADMCHRVSKSLAAADRGSSPLTRLAMRIRICVRHAHDDPLWGRFVYSFGFRAQPLQELWCGPTEDLLAEMQAGPLQHRLDGLPALLSFITGVVTGAIYLVATGRDTWRNAGAHAVEFILQALGVPSATASDLAGQELPPLLSDD